MSRALFLSIWIVLISLGGEFQSTRLFAQTNRVKGKLVSVGRMGIVIEADGRQVPVRANRDTAIHISGKGDSGFIVPGQVVLVTGYLTHSPSDGMLRLSKSAITLVHLFPRETAMPREKQASLTSGRPVHVIFNGVVESVKPLAVRMTDNIKFITVVGLGSPGAQPVSAVIGSGGLPRGSLFPLDCEIPKSVKLSLGTDIRRVPAGTPVSASGKPGNPFASAIWITSRKELKAEDFAPKPAAKKKTKKKNGK